MTTAPKPQFLHGVTDVIAELKRMATFAIDTHTLIPPIVAIHQLKPADKERTSLALIPMEGQSKPRIEHFIKKACDGFGSVYFMDEAWQVVRDVDSTEEFTDIEVSEQPDKEESVFIMDYADHSMWRVPIHRDKDGKPCLGEWECKKAERIEGRFGPDEPKEDG